YEGVTGMLRGHHSGQPKMVARWQLRLPTPWRQPRGEASGAGPIAAMIKPQPPARLGPLPGGGEVGMSPTSPSRAPSILSNVAERAMLQARAYGIGLQRSCRGS